MNSDASLLQTQLSSVTIRSPGQLKGWSDSEREPPKGKLRGKPQPRETT